LSFDDWTAENIDKRQTMLMALARDIWKVKEMEAGR